jgi:putative endonuclease
MSYAVYILQSDTTKRLYIGQTSDLKRQISRHNPKEKGSTGYTHRQKRPWRFIYSEAHPTRAEAMKKERFLKSG